MAIVHSPIFGLFITLAAYRISTWLYEKSGKNLLLHPFVLSMLSVACLLNLLDISYERYLHQTDIIQFLLGPATVALAWPMYQQVHHLKAIWQRLALIIVLSTILASLCCVLLAWLMQVPPTALASLLGKSITTPIALELTQMVGGIVTLTAGVVAITGVLGAVTGPWILQRMKIEDDRVKGLVLGSVSHAIGTVRAFEISTQAGAFASIALSFMGIVTILLMPIIWYWLIPLL